MKVDCRFLSLKQEIGILKAQGVDRFKRKENNGIRYWIGKREEGGRRRETENRSLYIFQTKLM